ncbi:MAG: lysophospholipid acyltransferase family protein [Verrucomicrobiota bacterium]
MTVSTDNSSPDTPSANAPKPVVKHIRGWQLAALQPFGWLMRAWVRSLRYSASPESTAALSWVERPVAITLWHNRLLLSGEVVRRFRGGRPSYALVSPSKDGAWLSAFFRLVGIHTVRGSSHKLGREAVTALVGVLREGKDIGVTPDGPRGPIYEMKPGALIVARRTRSPLLLLGMAYESAWRLPSWDRFAIPRPFSRVRFYGRLVETAALNDRESAAKEIEALLKKMNPDSDLEPEFRMAI